ncbi:hypothetical protein CsSME_00039849 [Camellia sinensis var. sinensis]
MDTVDNSVSVGGHLCGCQPGAAEELGDKWVEWEAEASFDDGQHGEGALFCSAPRRGLFFCELKVDVGRDAVLLPERS